MTDIPAGPSDEQVAFPPKPGDTPPDDYARVWYEAGSAAEKAKVARLQDALEGREKQSHDFAMDLLDRIHHWQSHSDDIGRTVLSELRSVYHASHRGKPVMRDGECLLCSALDEPPA